VPFGNGEEFAEVIGELFAPFEVIGQDLFKIIPGTDSHHRSVKGFDRSETFGIPGATFRNWRDPRSSPNTSTIRS
jgi:hypothetical protein